MTTETGRAFVLQRLSDAPDLAALQRVWGTLSNAYTSDPIVLQHKQQLLSGYYRDTTIKAQRGKRNGR